MTDPTPPAGRRSPVRRLRHRAGREALVPDRLTVDWQFEAADVAARAELAAVKARLRAPIRSSHRLSLRELASLALL